MNPSIPDVSQLHSLAAPGATIVLGDGIQIDSLPDLTIEEGCSLRIGDRTVLRRDVEIRITKGASVILGDDVKIDRGVRIIATNGSTVEIGNESAIGLGSVLNGGDSIHDRQTMPDLRLRLPTDEHAPLRVSSADSRAGLRACADRTGRRCLARCSRLSSPGLPAAYRNDRWEQRSAPRVDRRVRDLGRRSSRASWCSLATVRYVVLGLMC